MFSVTYTGMNFLPLCTASVCPTISGMTVERRDHVLMTFFSVPRFITSIFSRSGVSTNGPFLSERPIALLLPSLDDELVGDLAFSRLISLGRQPPRRHRVPSPRRLAFAPAERMVDRIHRHTAHVRPLTEPATPSGFADRHVLVVQVADLPDRRKAFHIDRANL